ncbi:hypothetical protein BH10PAT3_BH10PAT3_5370 [soil metagenome]
MIMLMNILRKLFIGLLAGLLSITLFGMAWANIGVATIRDRQKVKGWFKSSNFYAQLPDVVLEKVNNDKKNPSTPGEPSSAEGDLPIKDPQIQAIVKQAFTPALLQNSVESVLNGTYKWLDGSAKGIDFSIDLTTAKQQFATGLGTYVTNRATSLPVCTDGQINGNFDGFNATCRPAAVSPADAGAIATADFLKQDFLKDPVITAKNLKADSAEPNKEGNPRVPLEESAAVAKTVYQRSGQLPLILGVLSLLLAMGIIFISRDRLRGIRRVGYVLVSTGVFLLITYLILGAGFTAASRKLAESNSDGPFAAKLITNFASSAIADVKSVLVWYVASFIGLGILACILPSILKKRQQLTGKGLLEHEVSSDHIGDKLSDSNKPELEKDPQIKL